MRILGIHHVTAITADARRNAEFYTTVLGLRLIKRTVNFDDPSSYHLYYGDGLGSPGTVITFFAWPDARHGRVGTGQASVTAFSVPEGSLGFWSIRLNNAGCIPQALKPRFGCEVLGFADPDGLQLELIACPADPRQPWREGPVPVQHAIRGLHGVTLAEQALLPTGRLLAGRMGLRLVGNAGSRYRYELPDGAAGTAVDVLDVRSGREGAAGPGAAHHIAWRTPDDGQQQVCREDLLAAGLKVSEPRDRVYFRSIYFREPGGSLFEIATDGPGFAADEPVERLGSSLKLPPWLEQRRDEIERSLPPWTPPGGRETDGP